MKIRVTTEGKSVTVDMEPKFADKVFKALVLQLLQDGGDKERHSEPYPSKPVENISKSEAMSVKNYEKLDGLYQYKGFFYTICPECGRIRGFCSKKEIEGFHCFKCGADIPFTEELLPLHVNCECGHHFKYMTNMKEKMFDINCIDCGNPVAVRYNDKRNSYETI